MQENSDFTGVLYKKFREAGSPGVRESGRPGVRESGRPGVRESGRTGDSIKGRVSCVRGHLAVIFAREQTKGEIKASEAEIEI